MEKCAIVQHCAHDPAAFAHGANCVEFRNDFSEKPFENAIGFAVVPRMLRSAGSASLTRHGGELLIRGRYDTYRNGPGSAQRHVVAQRARDTPEAEFSNKL